MSIRRSSLICVAHLQVYERVADNRWWPNIGGLLYNTVLSYLVDHVKSVRSLVHDLSYGAICSLAIDHGCCWRSRVT